MRQRRVGKLISTDILKHGKISPAQRIPFYRGTAAFLGGNLLLTSILSLAGGLKIALGEAEYLLAEGGAGGTKLSVFCCNLARPKFIAPCAIPFTAGGRGQEYISFLNKNPVGCFPLPREGAGGGRLK